MYMLYNIWGRRQTCFCLLISAFSYLSSKNTCDIRGRHGSLRCELVFVFPWFDGFKMSGRLGPGLAGAQGDGGAVVAGRGGPTAPAGPPCLPEGQPRFPRVFVYCFVFFVVFFGRGGFPSKEFFRFFVAFFFSAGAGFTSNGSCTKVCPDVFVLLSLHASDVSEVVKAQRLRYSNKSQRGGLVQSEVFALWFPRFGPCLLWCVLFGC